jgi:hypothetical protein
VQDISFSLEHVDTPELAFGAAPTVLAKGASKAFSIRFAPAQLGAFSARVPIEVNGLYTVHVALKATVVARCVELADKAASPLDLGALRVGRNGKCAVELVNRAALSATVDFAPAQALLERYNVKVEPGALTLVARSKGSVTLVFAPKARMAPFSAEVCVAVSGVRTPLLTLTGAALGLEVKLGASALPFGTVILGSQTTRTMQLINSGAAFQIVLLILLRESSVGSHAGKSPHAK